jgi:hypothetical protein
MKKLIGILLFSICLADISAAPKPKKIGSIPFEMVGTYVVIKGKINDSSPLNLILESEIPSLPNCCRVTE